MMMMMKCSHYRRRHGRRVDAFVWRFYLLSQVWIGQLRLVFS